MTIPAADAAVLVPPPGEEAALPGVRGHRPAGLADAEFAAVMAASVLIEGGRPDTFATGQQITAFFRGHANQTRGAAGRGRPGVGGAGRGPDPAVLRLDRGGWHPPRPADCRAPPNLVVEQRSSANGQ
jgi:hypothetical protein